MEGKRVRRAEPYESRRDAAWVSAVTEEVMMEGKRFSSTAAGTVTPQRTQRQRQKKKSGVSAGLIAVAAAALIAVGGAAGLGVYANSYDYVFPGVTVGDTDLSGLTYDELTQNLTADKLLAGTVEITANGQELGSYSQAQMGATVDTGTLYSEIWQVGRGDSWLQNTMTMLKGRSGAKTELEPVISDYNPSLLKGIAQEAAENFYQAPIDGSYELTPEGLFATRPKDGQMLNQEGLVTLLSELEEGVDSVDAPWDPVPAQQLDMAEMQQNLRSEATNPRYDTTLKKVVDGEPGIALDVEAAKAVLEAAAPGERVQLPGEPVYPTMTAEQMQAVLFRDVLGTATTTVGGTSVRKGNVKLSGESCNGIVLNDGDIFDYNKVVGERTTARGFGAAPSYVNGQTVDTVGGGICQTSSTIYWAALLSNLDIVERYAHRYVPAYVPKGMDATVSWGGPEFRFRNNTGYPIRLDVSYANSQITVTIVGTKTDDTYVKMTNEVLSTTSPKTEYVETSSLAPGVQKQTQSPYTGYEVVTYRNIYDGNGNLISSKQEAKSSYKSRNTIIQVGKSAPAPAPSTDAEPALP
ncbi:MAG: VanW family protein [Oscillospiraceae bacterium]|nr:VanW family protein [Oscillospiraceae bacterium]